MTIDVNQFGKEAVMVGGVPSWRQVCLLSGVMEVVVLKHQRVGK